MRNLMRIFLFGVVVAFSIAIHIPDMSNDLKARVNEARIPNISKDLKLAFYVNLDRMPSRKAHMEEQLKTTGLNARRLSGVDWQHVVDGDFDSDYVTRQGIAQRIMMKPAKESNGTIGCFLSHITALNEAKKVLHPEELVLVLEDDVIIPSDWQLRTQLVLDQAPKDWQLLKLSGWGTWRRKDLVRRPDLSSLVEEFFRKSFNPWSIKVPYGIFAAMRTPFEEPAFLNWGNAGFGSPNYFYAGTAAYLVRGSGITTVINHLRNQPINDLDGMMLSPNLPFYEFWPHVFELSHDAFYGPGLHGYGKALDEQDSPLDRYDIPVPRRSSKHAARASSVADKSQVSTASSARTMATAKNDRVTKAPPADLHESIRRVVVKNHGQSVIHREVDDGQATASRGMLPEQSRFGHPLWVKECAIVYLDVGSGTGEQVQKLFEPDRYPGDPMLRFFEEHIGSSQDRILPETQTGICAFGLEPNPEYRTQLRRLQEDYMARGWHVHFYPFAAWSKEGFTVLGEAQVRTVSLSEFVLSLPLHSVKLMKVDINGDEYETVTHMLRKGVLCRGVIDTAIVESYTWGDISTWADNRSFDAISRRVGKAKCGYEGRPSTIVGTRDEISDEAWTAEATLGERSHMKAKISRYFAAGLILVIALTLGFKNRNTLASMGKLGQTKTASRSGG